MVKLLPISRLFPLQPNATFALNLRVNDKFISHRNLNAADMRELGKLFKYGSRPNPNIIPRNVEAMEYWLLNAAWYDQEAARELADFYNMHRDQGKLNSFRLWRALVNFSIDQSYIYILRPLIVELTGVRPIDTYET